MHDQWEVEASTETGIYGRTCVEGHAFVRDPVHGHELAVHVRGRAVRARQLLQQPRMCQVCGALLRCAHQGASAPAQLSGLSRICRTADAQACSENTHAACMRRANQGL